MKPTGDKATTEKVVGTLQLRSVGLKCTKKKKKSIKCALCKKFLFLLQKDMNIHLKNHHPDFHFKCSYCPEDYKTYNGWYKHECKTGQNGPHL